MKNLRYLLLLFIIVLAPACMAAEHKWVIAFAQDEMRNDFRKAQVLEARKEADKHANVNFIYSDAEGQTSLLIRQIDKYIQQ